MKKLFTVAAAAMSSLSTVAFAQGSVTLYGIIDAGIAYTSNVAAAAGKPGASKVQAVSGLGLPSRWGLRGTEDLGGGNSALFVLENGFNVQNGTMQQGGREFGRQAYVGLANSRFGTFSLGRQYDVVFEMIGPYASARQYVGMMGSHIGDIDNIFATFRPNNSVKYTSANYGGATFSGLYAFSNQSAGPNGTGFSNNSAWSAGANYTNGKFSAATAYFHLTHPSAGGTTGTNTGGAIVGDYASPTGLFYNRAVAAQDVIGAGVSYQGTTYGFNALYTFGRLNYMDSSRFEVSNYELNGRYIFSPALRGGLAVIYSQGNMQGTNLPGVTSGAHPEWIQFNAGIVYSLSLRTELYASAVYQQAMHDALAAAIDGSGGPTGIGVRHQFAATVGLRHKF